jgi:hypothetical protein
MTNKTERFLVMSEAEFEAALRLRTDLAYCPARIALKLRSEYDKAEAACRARPVVEVATGHYESEEFYK